MTSHWSGYSATAAVIGVAARRAFELSYSLRVMGRRNHSSSVLAERNSALGNQLGAPHPPSREAETDG